MGLAPYGEPKYARTILDHLIDLKPDGSFKLDLDYFNYCVGLTMTNAKFDRLFGAPPRAPDQKLEPFHMDLAASIQQVTEEILLRMTRAIAKETGERNLCLAGGVALNCVANGKVLRDGSFDRIWIQPAAGDAGGSIGAALCAYHLLRDKPRWRCTTARTACAARSSGPPTAGRGRAAPARRRRAVSRRAGRCGAR
jgi:carbamoyltransferase